MKKDLLYAATCLCFVIVIGAGLYEHLAVVPQWSAAPPLSLSMFQGPYGLKAETFWKLIHPVNLALFAATIAAHWRSPRRRSVLAAFGGYVAVLIITFIYFVPELIAITTTPIAAVADPSLTKRAALWEELSLIRLVFLVTLSLVLFTGMTKPASARQLLNGRLSKKAVREEYA